MAVRTLTVAGANEISGVARIEILSAAPIDSPEIVNSNPQRMNRILIARTPLEECASRGPDHATRSMTKTCAARYANRRFHPARRLPGLSATVFGEDDVDGPASSYLKRPLYHYEDAQDGI